MTGITLREQLKRARVSAREALAHWGLHDEPLKVLRNLQNTTFQVGGAHVLRLSHPGYQSDRAIASEVMLLEYFAGLDLPVPRPVRPDTGTPFIKVGGSRAVLFSRQRGRFASALFGARKARLQGELVANVHDASANFRAPQGFYRLRFSPETLLGGRAGDEASVATPQLIRSVLGPRKAEIIARSVDLVRSTWETLGEDYIIHTDITPWNTLWFEGNPFLIDFDDAAMGPLAYDLGVIRCEYGDLRDSERLWPAFIEGYTSVRELPPGLPEGLLGLVAGRHLLVATWLAQKIDNPQFAPIRDWLEARIVALTEILTITSSSTRGPAISVERP